jgi:hypothetical protein
LNPLYEAQGTLELYYSNEVELLEQALEGYCNASTQQDKESAMIDVKKYSSRLACLEHFCSLNSDKTNATQLPKLCILLGEESYQENNEQILLLAKIFRLLAQMSAPKWR